MKIMALCTVDKEKLKKQKNLSAEANLQITDFLQRINIFAFFK